MTAQEAERAYALFKARAVFDEEMRRRRRPHDPLPNYLNGRPVAGELPRVELVEEGGAVAAIQEVLQLNSDVFRELMHAMGRVRA